ncbi:photosynthetic reaction center subunit H [Rhodocyclus purpureus]|uniref:photosynthetic reaction center subunit H n=1 Tax=Rhodocyclus purpureus TaxID=1067 RepID=UPI0019137FA3|nr:photosynthetic reaction center subunit H [Rhodocyclus purpureus]MBK5914856.1 photosynthetic reaction center subunit H [Rhodocyclus purpureus]
MPSGAITSYVDVAQLTLYAFWIFFARLLIYLRREDKREGYPLEHDMAARTGSQGYNGLPKAPDPKTFLLRSGAEVQKPGPVNEREILAVPGRYPFAGAPLEATENPLIDGVGPASYALRADTPDTTLEGLPKIVPMRVATDFWLPEGETDPRGSTVVTFDREVAGTVVDIWVDRSEVCARYYEVEVQTANGTRKVLLPINFTKFIKPVGQVSVRALKAAQFADIPGLAHPDQVTLREEDRICAYFAGGKLYADPSRLGPLT